MKHGAWILMAAALLAAGLSGCAMFNRGMMNYTRNTTIGKELVDLKDAKDKGALSEEEYLKAKKEILAGGPVKIESGCKK
jgi:hypothetical protein